MKASPVYTNQSHVFWAHVRLLSQEIGYTSRRSADSIYVWSYDDLLRAFERLGLDTVILGNKNNPSLFAEDLLGYSKYRADLLVERVKPNLMTGTEAEKLFNALILENPDVKAPIPMNKQTGTKRKISYFTAIINILFSKHLGEKNCNYDPRKLAFSLQEEKVGATYSRRFDGAYPDVTDPKAVWEIKEYYYTTTFGSRVADAIYETMLDGYEIREFFNHSNKRVYHYLFVDAYLTWWEMGKPYLCRMIDAMHMGFVDEVIFGREAVERIPEIIKDWE